MIIGNITDGIVLDHITAGKGMDIYRVLELDKLDCSVAMIMNAESPKMGRKDIIKIGRIIDLDFTVLGYIDPGITVNIIRSGAVAKREHMKLPDKVMDVIHCKNPRCITSVERGLRQEFRLADREKKLYRCVFCESEAPAELIYPIGR